MDTMTPRTQALFGPLAAGLFFLGVGALPVMIPRYDAIRQTVSEIGEAGSPAQVPFMVLLCAVAACVFVFSMALHGLAKRSGRSSIPAYVTACLGLSTAGVGLFAYPHPLHNVFGLSELIGYQAPLALALTWARAPFARRLVRFSWIMAGVVWLAIAINLLPIFRPPGVWPHLKPVVGLVQRALFSAWFVWCAVAGWLLARADLSLGRRRSGISAGRFPPAPIVARRHFADRT
jgi:hypothetical membrane protein